MRFIADFHIHSHYSRATSKEMNIVELTKWAQLKGTNVVGTGDSTHPKWFAEMHDTLEEAEPGLFKLKGKFEDEMSATVPTACRVPMRFLLSSEISTIYKKHDRVRKVHTIILSPKFEYVAEINNRLQSLGANLKSDGRPIIGLDTKELTKIALDVSEDNMVIPAHLWTPHFSAFGSASGFDTLEECFDELTPEIFAVETGLSSDPQMNWRIRELDSRALVSNSDAHSARKLGREANVFNTELSYFAIRNALKCNDKRAFEATIEFYPEEGKYHLDGHRSCGTRLTPADSKRRNHLCPKCGSKVTVGVLSRVEELAEKDRTSNYQPKNARPYRSIVPLPDIIAEVEEVGVASKKVENAYMKILHELGNEFQILLETPLGDIEKCSSSLLAEAIRKMRVGDINLEGGYDGEFGTVSIFKSSERKKITSRQSTLFS